jgi:hypothetical protein
MCGRVVADMAAELRASDFAPLDFELDFGSDPEFPGRRWAPAEDIP